MQLSAKGMVVLTALGFSLITNLNKITHKTLKATVYFISPGWALEIFTPIFAELRQLKFMSPINKIAWFTMQNSEIAPKNPSQSCLINTHQMRNFFGNNIEAQLREPKHPGTTAISTAFMYPFMSVAILSFPSFEFCTYTGISESIFLTVPVEQALNGIATLQK